LYIKKQIQQYQQKLHKKGRPFQASPVITPKINP